ncbi:MAG TPA: TolC family protein [Bacillota bacterium]|nr:TolC family protein [Bacillota bacterium]
MFRKITLITLIFLLAGSVTTWAVDHPSNVLTLEKALELAYQNSKSLKAASQKVSIAREDLKKAEAAFVPSVDYSFGLLKYGEEQQLTQSDEGASGSINATWPIYTGNKLELALQIAKSQLSIALENERQVKQELTYNVKEAYYRVWMAEELLKVAQSSYANLDQHLMKVKQLYNVGNASKYDVLQAEVQKESLKPQIIKAENNVTLAKLALATLIGLDKNNSFTVQHHETEIQPNPLPSTDQLIHLAYNNRSELKQLKLQHQIVNCQVKLAASEYKPNIYISGSYGFESSKWSPNDWDPQFKLILGIQGNFYKATVKPEVESAKGQLELLTIQENDLKDSIHLQVEQAVQNILESTETIKANQANIELAKESLRMTQARYDAGMATTMDVTDAQLALDKALTGYYQGISDYLIACAKLDLVTAVIQ